MKKLISRKNEKTYRQVHNIISSKITTRRILRSLRIMSVSPISRAVIVENHLDRVAVVSFDTDK